MNVAITYLTIGTLFTLILDLLGKLLGDRDTKFSNRERIGVILVWPVGLVVFIYNFIRTLITNNRDE